MLSMGFRSKPVAAMNIIAIVEMVLLIIYLGTLDPTSTDLGLVVSLIGLDSALIVLTSVDRSHKKEAACPFCVPRAHSHH